MNWTKVRTIAFGVLAGAVASVGTLAVTVAGFALSYDAIRAVGQASHMRSGWAWLLPVSIDGAMAVATIAAVVLRRITGETKIYPWMVVLIGAVISVACNGLHAIPAVAPAPGVPLKIDDAPVRFAVSAIPAVMLTLSVHLLVTLIEAASNGIVRRSTATQKRADAVTHPINGSGDALMVPAGTHPGDAPATHDRRTEVAHPDADLTRVADAVMTHPGDAPTTQPGDAVRQVAPAAVTPLDAAPARRSREVVLRRPVSAPPASDAERDAAIRDAVAAVLSERASIRGAASDARIPEATVRRAVNRAKAELTPAINGHDHSQN